MCGKVRGMARAVLGVVPIIQWTRGEQRSWGVCVGRLFQPTNRGESCESVSYVCKVGVW